MEQTKKRLPAGAVRVREKKPDPHEGLRGHDYIKARGLNKPVNRITKKEEKKPLNFIYASGKMNFLNPENCDRRFFILPDLTVPEES